MATLLPFVGGGAERRLHGWVRTDMGGKQALLSPEESVAGMPRVIAGLAQADSGRFYNYDGSAIPW